MLGGNPLEQPSQANYGQKEATYHALYLNLYGKKWK